MYAFRDISGRKHAYSNIPPSIYLEMDIYVDTYVCLRDISGRKHTYSNIPPSICLEMDIYIDTHVCI